MTAHKISRKRFAICINNTDYPASLDTYKVYRVLPDKDAEQDGDIRIIDESGEDYLYPEGYFVLVDFPPATVRVLNRAYAHYMQRVG